MLRVAWNNLIHDGLRFLTAVVGVSFAITLITIQAGIFLGAIDSSALLVWKSDADLWIVPSRTVNADFAVTLPERRKYQALGTEGVEQAGRMIVGFNLFRFPNGRQEAVMIVGVDSNHDWLGLQEYRDRSVLTDRYVILDRREEDRFGEDDRPLLIGDELELGGYRAQVAGFADGMSSFIATPYVFCDFNAAMNYAGVERGQSTFVLVKVAPGADVKQVQKELQARMPDDEVLTRDVFATRSWKYWILGTGMGMALGLSAGLAFLVGVVIVGQTIFTSVINRLREYATLKAVGFHNSFVVGVVCLQSLAVVLIGYPISVGASLIFAHFAQQGGTAIVMRISPALLVVMFLVACVMCFIASLGALYRALNVPPAKVFR